MDKCPFGHDMSYPEEQSEEILDEVKKIEEAEGKKSIFTTEELFDSFQTLQQRDKVSVVSMDFFCPICKKIYAASECHSDNVHPFGSDKLS